MNVPDASFEIRPNSADDAQTVMQTGNGNSLASPNTDTSSETVPGLPNLGAGGPFQWPVPPWGDPSLAMFEPTDLQHWEYVLDNITQEQMLFGFQ